MAPRRAVYPRYNNNEKIRYENKIKINKNHKNDIFKMMIMMIVNS